MTRAHPGALVVVRATGAVRTVLGEYEDGRPHVEGIGVTEWSQLRRITPAESAYADRLVAELHRGSDASR